MKAYRVRFDRRGKFPGILYVHWLGKPESSKLRFRPHGFDEQRDHTLAYVGHDFGAMYGAVLSAIDLRPRAWARQAGTTSFSLWFLLGRKLSEAQRDSIVRRLAPLDPVRYIGEAAPAAVLVQFGRQDRFVPAERAQEFAEATRMPKRVL